MRQPHDLCIALSFAVLEAEAQEEERRLSDEAEKFVPVDITPPWADMTNCEIVNFLKSSVIFEDEDVLAINKPYGLSCQSNGKLA